MSLLHEDVESGPISKMERTIFIVNTILWHKKNLKTFLILWVVFVAYVFGVHINVMKIASSAVPKNTIALASRLVQNATDLFQETPLVRFERVRKNPTKYQQMVSTKFDFSTHVRTELPLETVVDSIQSVMSEHSFQCLAAIHIGIPKRIMSIGDNTYVNPVLSETGQSAAKQNSVEESAFYQGVKETKQRYKEVVVQYQTMDGVWTSDIMNGITSICAQHCLEAMGG